MSERDLGAKGKRWQRPRVVATSLAHNRNSRRGDPPTYAERVNGLLLTWFYKYGESLHRWFYRASTRETSPLSVSLVNTPNGDETYRNRRVVSLRAETDHHQLDLDALKAVQVFFPDLDGRSISESTRHFFGAMPFSLYNSGKI